MDKSYISNVRAATEVRLLEIARRIVHLEEEFAGSRSLDTAKQIARLEADYARLAGDDRPFAADAVVEKGTAADIPTDGRALTYAQRIESALVRSSIPITAQDIAASIGEPGALPTVRAILSKLVAAGHIDRVSTGLYRAGEAGHRRGASDDD